MCTTDGHELRLGRECWWEGGAGWRGIKGRKNIYIYLKKHEGIERLTISFQITELVSGEGKTWTTLHYVAPAFFVNHPGPQPQSSRHSHSSGHSLSWGQHLYVSRDTLGLSYEAMISSKGRNTRSVSGRYSVNDEQIKKEKGKGELPEENHEHISFSV